MSLSPIILFVYNRPEHTLRTLSALSKNTLASESDLFIFSDGAKSETDQFAVQEVRKIISKINGFKSTTLTLSETNKGLAESVISGVTKILEIYESVIVLEDDIETQPAFLTFSNEALAFYKDKKEIFSISGYAFPIELAHDYTHDVYIAPRASSWGWSTWADRWNKNDWAVSDFRSFIIDSKATKAFNQGGSDLTKMLQKQMNGKINSWAIRWCYTHFKNNAFCLYPSVSLVHNTGNDDSGTHSPNISKYNSKILSKDKVIKLNYPLYSNEIIIKNLKNFFTKKWKDRFEFIINKIFKK